MARPGIEPILYYCNPHSLSASLTNKAVGNIGRALFAKGSWSPSPLIVSRDSISLWTWARLQTARSTANFNGCPYIFLLYYYITIYFVYHILWPLRFGWLMVFSLYKEDYLQIFKCVSFWLHGCCGEWEGWALVNRFNHTSGVTAITPTDRPKSVRNRCVIEVLVAFFMLSRCFLDFSVGVRAFDWVRSLPFSFNVKITLNVKMFTLRVNN